VTDSSPNQSLSWIRLLNLPNLNRNIIDNNLYCASFIYNEEMGQVDFREKVLLYILGVLLLIILILTGYFFYTNEKLKEKKANQKSQSQNIINTLPDQIQKTKIIFSNSIVFANDKISDNELILKVGGENIFYKDFDIELANISKGKEVNDEMKKLALQKLINDSTIIQHSVNNRYIKTPSSSIYNSLDKDYSQRLDLIMQCEEKISNNEFEKISGNVLKILISNIDSGNLSLSDGKEAIRKKIVEIYANVKEGKVSIEEAMSNVAKIPEIVKMPNLDISSTTFEFDAVSNRKITEFPEFDKLIWQTPIGGITQIFHYSDFEDTEVYLFGHIKTKSNTGYASMKDFYEKNNNLYEVIIY